MEKARRIGIGIDTGGTYTDAVAYDFGAKKVVAAAKALTTKEDLMQGILRAMDGLPPECLEGADLLSLSTTLATNACVENRGGRAKLIFFGGDPRVVDELGGQYGLPPARDMLIEDSETTFYGEIVREPDWGAFEEHLKTGFDGLDGVGIIEMHGMKNGAAFEKQAKAIVQEELGLPVVCAHELFSELNALQRGASTLLNAQLFPVIRSFISGARAAAARRGIRGALVIVRSDGSMMSEAFALDHPVETLLCGPAASAVGGLALSSERDCVIVDMGGTTTDVAVAVGGAPVPCTGGVSVGKWKTFVNGLYIRTAGLGGDSAVHYDGARFLLEDYRVTPLCVAAAVHPAITENLAALAESGKRHSLFLHEHFALARDIGGIRGNPRYTEEEMAFCEAVRACPLPMDRAAAAVGKDVYTLRIPRLLADGVVQVCGLTPTDIMHIKGDFVGFDAKAARAAAAFVAGNLGITVEALCDQVYDAVKQRLYTHIVKALLENDDPRYREEGVGPEMERIIAGGYAAGPDAGLGLPGGGPLLAMPLRTRLPLVGIGAPIAVFLPDVAEKLGTRAVIPENYAVANAVGAVTTSVSVFSKVEVLPIIGEEGPTFAVYAADENRRFATIEEAVAFGVRAAREAARREAALRGAKGNIVVTDRVQHHEVQAKNEEAYLGATVTAHAIGAASA
ncbi:MAG: hydantoinase/oxoprolinase family protein [Clostridiales Family XIII bacterium]|jgi:N-methylhydantoinase A/oxoprolinase/acetone carboxylase beta subunit|nr:hydantoinase/oxoprolinase family protein [Clostridiales Family XIII bacterium]